MVGSNLFAPGRSCGGLYYIARLFLRSPLAETYIALHGATREAVLLTCSRFEHLDGDPLAPEAFLADAEKLRQLTLPGVPEVREAGIDSNGGGVYWIASSYIEARSALHVEVENRALAARAGKPRGRSNPRGLVDALNVAMAVAAMLGDAHEQAAILHEDITPDRIRLASLTNEFTPILLGLGHGMLFRMNRAVAIATPRYRSPEQIAGEAFSVRSDIYALGMVLYELIGLTPPYAEQAPLSDDPCLLSLVEQELPARLPDAICSPAAWAVLEKAIQKDPTRRFSSWDEMKEAMEGTKRVAMSDTSPVVVKPVNKEPRAPTTVPPGPSTKRKVRRATQQAWTREATSADVSSGVEVAEIDAPPLLTPGTKCGQYWITRALPRHHHVERYLATRDEDPGSTFVIACARRSKSSPSLPELLTLLQQFCSVSKGRYPAVRDGGVDPLSSFTWLAHEYIETLPVADLLSGTSALESFPKLSALTPLLKAQPLGIRWALAISVGVTIAALLDRFVSKGLVHGSLDPRMTIAFRADTTPVVLDIGFRQIFGARPSDLRLDSAFRAPEQIDGDEPDVRGDIYSLGATLYFIVTGVLPMGERPKPLVDLVGPRLTHFSEIVARAMERDPAKRFQKWEDLRDPLEEIFDAAVAINAPKPALRAETQEDASGPQAPPSGVKAAPDPTGDSAPLEYADGVERAAPHPVTPPSSAYAASTPRMQEAPGVNTAINIGIDLDDDTQESAVAPFAPKSSRAVRVAPPVAEMRPAAPPVAEARPAAPRTTRRWWAALAVAGALIGAMVAHLVTLPRHIPEAMEAIHFVPAFVILQTEPVPSERPVPQGVQKPRTTEQSLRPRSRGLCDEWALCDSDPL